MFATQQHQKADLQGREVPNKHDAWLQHNIHTRLHSRRSHQPDEAGMPRPFEQQHAETAILQELWTENASKESYGRQWITLRNPADLSWNPHASIRWLKSGIFCFCTFLWPPMRSTYTAADEEGNLGRLNSGSKCNSGCAPKLMTTTERCSW